MTRFAPRRIRRSRLLEGISIPLLPGLLLVGFLAGGGATAPRRATSFEVQFIEMPGISFDLASADFDEDGIADLAVVDLVGDRVSFLLGEPGGFFRRSEIALENLVGPRRIKAGDFDLDGHADLALLHVDTPGSHLRIWHGDGTLSFQGGFREDAPFSYDSMQVADLDADGALDLVVDLVDEGFRVLLGDGSGGFFGQTLGEYRFSMQAVADHDGDGVLDVVATAGRPVFIFRGDGAGGFGGQEWLLAGQGVVKALSPASDHLVMVESFPHGRNYTRLVRNGEAVDGFSSVYGDYLVRLDVDGDLIDDVLVSNGFGEFQAVLMDDDPPAFRTVERTPGVGGTMFAVGDWDRDGRPDIATIGLRAGQRAVVILWNRTHLKLEARWGSVNQGAGSVEDVLLANGSPGRGRDRVLKISPVEPFRLEMRKPAQARNLDFVPFAAYAWPCEPTAVSHRVLPFGMGRIALPVPLTGGRPQPAVIWNNAGRRSKLGAPTRPSSGAGEVFFDRPRGLRRLDPFYIQGLIFDPGSAGPVPASVTNGIWVTFW